MNEKLIGAYQSFFKEKGEEVSAEAAEGSIAMWMNGQGEMLSELVSKDPELWQPVVDAYSSHPKVEEKKSE